MVTSGGVPARSHGAHDCKVKSSTPLWSFLHGVCRVARRSKSRELAACPVKPAFAAGGIGRGARSDRRTSTHEALVGATGHGLEWQHVSTIP